MSESIRGSLIRHLRKVVPACVLLLGGVSLAACQDSDVDLPEAASEPGGLRGLVVFEREADVFLQEIAGSPRLLARGASYPRFSPDGTRIAAVSGKRIMVVDVGSGKATAIARAGDPRAVAWHPGGDSVYFTDGNTVKSANAAGGDVRVVASGHRFLELDVGPRARYVVGTVKGFGFSIVLVDTQSGKARKLESGCSASFSPDGGLVSNLLDGHEALALLRTPGGERARVLRTRGGVRYDNHFWTNDPDWIAGELEGSRRDIVLIHAKTGEIRKVTDVGNATRGDVFIRQ